MGKISPFVNTWACIWTAFVAIIFLFPTVRPVTGENMNYAIAFLIAILIAAMLYWFIRGRHFYTGPIVEAQVIRDDESGDGDFEKKMDNEPFKPSGHTAV
jgi:LPXTG-motif cell wall-anchored protein